MNVEARIMELKRQCEPVVMAMVSHDLWKRIDTIENLKQFMEVHVYCVFDYMSLLKSIQYKIAGSSIPWLPSIGVGNQLRLINEIAIGEESDVAFDVTFKSHLEMYLDAMNELGADCSAIHNFILAIERGMSWPSAAVSASAPKPAYNFMLHTFRCIEEYSFEELVAVFVFSREDNLYRIFEVIIEKLESSHSKFACSQFKYYLNRHIELDSNEHSNLAMNLLRGVLADKNVNWQELKNKVLTAIYQRHLLWNNILDYMS